jgi:hypothetical protein
MEIEIADRLNSYLEDMMNLLRKVKNNCSLEFKLCSKITHEANFSFEKNNFEHRFTFLTKILKTQEIQNLNFFEENFEHLSNLNTTLIQYKNKFELTNDNSIISNSEELNENLKNDFHSPKFEYTYTNFENSYTKQDRISPILVDDFINKEIDKLNFIYSLENSDNLWKDPTLEPEKLTFLYFSPYENKISDLKILEDLNELAEKNKTNEYRVLRPIFILPSGVSENRKFSYERIDLLDNSEEFLIPKLLNNQLLKGKIENNCNLPNNLQEIENYEISSYDKEHSLRDFESTKDFEFALNFFNSLREKLSEEFEYYFLDRRHFLNEKLNFFEEGKGYLINSKGVIINIINFNKENAISKVQDLKINLGNDQFIHDNYSSFESKQKLTLSDTIPCIEKLIKNLCYFKMPIRQDFSEKIYVDKSWKINYTLNFKFEILKDSVNLVKISTPELDYIIPEEFSDKLKILIKNLGKCTLGIKDFGCIYADKSQKLNQCLSYLDSILKKEKIDIDISDCIILNQIKKENVIIKEYIFRIQLEKLLANLDLEILKILCRISKGDQLKFLLDTTFSEWILLPKIEVGHKYIPLENMNLLEILDNGKIKIKNNVLLKPETSQISNSKEIDVFIFWNPFNISNYQALNEIVAMVSDFTNESSCNFKISSVALGVDSSDKSTVCKVIISNRGLIDKLKKIKFFITDPENTMYEEVYNIKVFGNNLPCVMVISEGGKIETVTSNQVKLEEILYSFKEL